MKPRLSLVRKSVVAISKGRLQGERSRNTRFRNDVDAECEEIIAAIGRMTLANRKKLAWIVESLEYLRRRAR